MNRGLSFLLIPTGEIPMNAWAWRGFCPVLMALLLSGCLRPERKDDGLIPPPQNPIKPGKLYTLAYPDVVDIVFADWPDLGETVGITSEGTVDLGVLGKICVEGETLAEARHAIAERACVSRARVHIQVAEFNSRKIFLFGQVSGEARAVPYQGPETVVELLCRTNALTPDSAWNQIHLVRAHLTEGMPAEIMHIDLDAILQRGDERTNIRVQPLDEIYVGEKPSSYIRRLVPTILKPVFESCVGLVPDSHPDPPRALAGARAGLER